MTTLRVTWKKSSIGYAENQKRTIRSLGLRKLGQSVDLIESRPVRGMITTVRHLVDVQEVPGS